MGVECPILRLNLKAEAQTLIDALALDALDEWAAIVVAIPAAEPLAWLAAIGKAYLELALQGPRRYEAAFLLHFEKSRRYPDDFVERRGPAGRPQLELIGRLIEQGILNAASPIEPMVTNSVLSQGLVTLYGAGRP